MTQQIDLPFASHPDPEIAVLLSLLANTTNEWREMLAVVPPDLVVRQLHADGHSIGAVLLHIADVEGFWLHEGFSGQVRPPEVVDALLSKETDQAHVHWPTPPAETVEWYYARLDAVRARTLDLARTLRSADQVLMHPARLGKTYTARWLLGHVVTHEAYHGGQAVLLSLMPARLTA